MFPDLMIAFNVNWTGWGLLRLSAKSYVKQNRSFLLDTANGSSGAGFSDATRDV